MRSILGLGNIRIGPPASWFTSYLPEILHHPLCTQGAIDTVSGTKQLRNGSCGGVTSQYTSSFGGNLLSSGFASRPFHTLPTHHPSSAIHWLECTPREVAIAATK